MQRAFRNFRAARRGLEMTWRGFFHARSSTHKSLIVFPFPCYNGKRVVETRVSNFSQCRIILTISRCYRASRRHDAVKQTVPARNGEHCVAADSMIDSAANMHFRLRPVYTKQISPSRWWFIGRHCRKLLFLAIREAGCSRFSTVTSFDDDQYVLRDLREKKRGI